MAVQITDGTYTVLRTAIAGTDSHGDDLPGASTPTGPPLPGASKENSDGSWGFALDPGHWPVRTGDHVAHDGRTFLVQRAQLIGSPELPEAPALAGLMDVSFIRVVAAEVTSDGTEPGGPEFVGRPGG